MIDNIQDNTQDAPQGNPQDTLQDTISGQDTELDLDKILDQLDPVESNTSEENSTPATNTQDDKIKPQENDPTDVIKKELEKYKQDQAKLQQDRDQLEKERHEQQAIQEAQYKSAIIDNDIANLEKEANSIIERNKKLVNDFNAGLITPLQYDSEKTAILSKTHEILTRGQQLEQQKQQIPTPEKIKAIEDVKIKNDNHFKNKKIEDDLIKKHLEKAKKEYFDPFGIQIENNPAWDKVVDQLETAIKEGEKRGYQKATEKINERLTKGKLPQGAAAKGGKSIKSIGTIDDILNAKPEDLAKLI